MGMSLKRVGVPFILALGLLRAQFAFAAVYPVPLAPQNTWLQSEAGLSVGRIMMNISPADAQPGVVVAAQTRVAPNYYYHWVRDAGLTMDAVASQYEVSNSASEKKVLRRKLNEYFEFSESIQTAPTLTGMGEPKFNTDGTGYMGSWGRPQNDAPALRAISMIHWFNILHREGISPDLQKRYYDGKIPTDSVIKRDLEYVSHHWRDASFDLWEEIKGDHFYTRMVQRRAMIEGARLADALKDPGAAVWYRKQAQEIQQSLMAFWDPFKGHFVATLNQVEGMSTKVSGLDTAVILGLLHGSVGDGFLPFSDPKVQSTIAKLTAAFTKTYAINRRADIPGTAIGRYPEDRYGGDNFDGGNPWPLCTLALAEADFRAAAEARRQELRVQALDLVQKGEQFVARVRYHANADGSLNEQINRDTGYMLSVSDLTWNYASVLTTSFARAPLSRGL
jgi:glucoamylase